MPAGFPNGRWRLVVACCTSPEEFGDEEGDSLSLDGTSPLASPVRASSGGRPPRRPRRCRRRWGPEEFRDSVIYDHNLGILWPESREIASESSRISFFR